MPTDQFSLPLEGGRSDCVETPMESEVRVRVKHPDPEVKP